MSWLLLATVGQFLNALVAILDKYLVSDEKRLPKPFVYAFYSCIFTSFWVVIYFVGLVPGLSDTGIPQFSNVHRPTLQVVALSFLAGYTFFMALVSMFTALKAADASDVMPVIGATSAVATFLLSYVFLDARLEQGVILGIVLLACGTLLVSGGRFSSRTGVEAVHSGVFFALHYITMKGLFLETNFDDGFFWSRIGFVLFALSLLLVPVYFEKIVDQTKNTSSKTGFFVLLTKIIAGVAAFLLLKATDWGDVAVVQALEGLKFVFILILSTVFGRYLPFVVREDEGSVHVILKKVLYVTIIVIGFVLLFN